jgi:hypothetical protein
MSEVAAEPTALPHVTLARPPGSGVTPNVSPGQIVALP